MRKFTSLMLMLLCAVTTMWAGPTDLPQITTDLNNPIYYTISNTRSTSGKLLYYTEEGVKDATPQQLTDAYKFYFTGTSLDDIRIHNAAAGDLLFAGTGAWTAEGTSVAIEVTPHESNSGLAIKFNGTSLNEQNTGNGYTTWGANDAGSIFVMDLVTAWPEDGKLYTIEAPLFYSVQGVNKGLMVNEDGSLCWNTIDITNKNCYWQVEYNSENEGYAIKNVGTGKYVNGTTVSDAVENYAKINYLSQCQFNIVVNNTTMHANGHGSGGGASGNIVTWSGSVGSASAWQFVEADKRFPFVAAEKYDEITKWYYLSIGDDAYLLYHVDDADHIALDRTAVDYNNEDAYMWAFVGTPFDGYKIVNRATGDGYILSSSTNTFDGNTGANTHPVMTAEPVAEGNNTYWIPTASKNRGGVGTFYLAQKNANDGKNKMNNRGGKLAFWNSGADAGSTFMVIDVESAHATMINDFKTAALSGLGCVGGYAADKENEIEAISSIEEMKSFKNANELIAFEVNKYYRIQNVYRKTFISVANGERVLKEGSKADINQLWQVEEGTDGAYLIKSPNAGYMQAVGNNALVSENGAEFRFNYFKEYAGQYGILNKDNNDMLAGINATTLGTWWGGGIDGDMSYRFIETEEVEITLSDIAGEGWATAYLPFDVTLPEGLIAYYASEVSNGYVKFAEIEDVPANNGVVLYTTEPKTYTLNIADASSEIESNLLNGTTTQQTITKENGSYYVLANGNNGIGFYSAKNGDDMNTFINAANKAYLHVPAAAGSAEFYGFNFDGTTAIEGVEVENVEKVIYDLTGRRIEKITKAGIYIVNGNKVLVK